MAGARALVSAKQVYARLTSVRRARQEHFVVFCLNARGCATARQLVSVGTVNETLVHPREVFYPAILNNATSVIVPTITPLGTVSLRMTTSL